MSLSHRVNLGKTPYLGECHDNIIYGAVQRTSPRRASLPSKMRVQMLNQRSFPGERYITTSRHPTPHPIRSLCYKIFIFRFKEFQVLKVQGDTSSSMTLKSV